jgi:large subunit ribosomal protein L22
MKATLSDYKQSPRKVRLVANLVRGKSTARAKELLTFADKKSAPALQKLLNSAIANAQQKGVAIENLFIKEIQVNQGLSMTRYMPRARGRAAPYRHRRSQITVVLDAKKSGAKTSAKTLRQTQGKKAIKKTSKTKAKK